MSKPKLLLIGYRAYGDWLFAAPVLPHLFDKYDVYADINQKGYQLFYDDPRFKRITVCDIESFPPEEAEELAKERWAKLEEQLKPDKVINLWRTLEVSCIAEKWQSEFYLPVLERRKIFGHKNFYEAVFEKAEILMPDNLDTTGLWFSEEFQEAAKKWRAWHLNDFIIMMAVAGTCIHKVWSDMYKYCDTILDKYPNAYIYLVGDESGREYQWDHPRAIKTCGEFGIKQTILMTKYADYVIGPETGVLVAPGMFGTHKTMLNTAAGLEQCHKYQKNDHSIQAGVPCSPCHRAIYNLQDCELVSVLNSKAWGCVGGEEYPHPACVDNFDFNKILEITEEVYNKRNLYNDYYYERYINMSGTDKGREIYKWRWDLVNKHCSSGVLLDYGCATGAFLDEVNCGDRVLYGYDINPNTKKKYKRLPGKAIDIMTMWDVMEHLKKPKDIISKINPGWLFITIPNVAEAPEDIAEWKHYRPGEHLHQWDLINLTRDLATLGYSVKEVSYGEGKIRDPQKPKDLLTVVAQRS